jgi:hypothetical protein
MDITKSMYMMAKLKKEETFKIFWGFSFNEQIKMETKKLKNRNSLASTHSLSSS